MESLSFRIPEQTAPGEDSFDTRPAAVLRWVEELPMGHIGETAKRLFAMLKEVNQLEVPLNNRFELMEAVSAPLHTVFEALERHYTGLAFPLPRKSLRVAQVMTGLLQETVIGYQAVLNSEENASWLFRKTHSRLWIEVVHRLVYYLYRILRTYQLLHRSASPGIWMAMHELYWRARESKRHQERADSLLSGESTSIEQEYLRAILLSMVEPQLLSREQMVQVMANMPLWMGRCELMAVSADDDIPGYCVRRDVDSPFTLFAERCCSDCEAGNNSAMLLDIGGLALRIAGLLEQLGDEESVRPDGGSVISRETLEVLRDSWRVHDSVREERAGGDSNVEVAVSMNGIFQLLKGHVDPTARGISDQTLRDDLQELELDTDGYVSEIHNHGTMVGAKNDEDVWSNIFYATEMTQKSWSREVDEQEYRFIDARQRNHTDAGYCLEFKRDSVEPFQVGELMGVRRAEGSVLELGMIRWLTDSSKQLTAGLLRLAESMEPALVVVHTEERRTALYCLLGIGRDQRPQLFLPHLPGIRHKQLFLVVDAKEVPLALHDQVVASPLFNAFHFEVASVSTEEGMSLPEFNREMHALTHPERQEEREPGDFSDLWDSL